MLLVEAPLFFFGTWNKKLLLYVSLIFLLPSVYSIFLHRLSSWFGFDDTVIFWLTSYLSSRSFVVSINSTSYASDSYTAFKSNLKTRLFSGEKTSLAPSNFYTRTSDST